MKRFFAIVLLITGICILASFVLRHYNAGQTKRVAGLSQTSKPSFTNLPPQISRLTLLEKAGEIPEGDDDIHDWQLAHRTSWWGKPLDPYKFWKGRLIWNDEKAVLDANRHGRLYAPIPYENTNLPAYPNDDGFHSPGAIEGPNISYSWSSKEAAFWDLFDKTNVRPPDQIDKEQYLAAQYFLRGGDSDNIRSGPISMGYPAAAFTTNALFWAYVESNRAEYEGMLGSYGDTNDPHFRSFFTMLLIDKKYVTEPLSSNQLIAEAAAMGWRIAYIKQLRDRKVDPSYINAYLQAWNISADQLN